MRSGMFIEIYLPVNIGPSCCMRTSKSFSGYAGPWMVHRDLLDNTEECMNQRFMTISKLETTHTSENRPRLDSDARPLLWPSGKMVRTWDGTGCEFDSWQLDMSYPMFIEPTIIRIP